MADSQPHIRGRIRCSLADNNPHFRRRDGVLVCHGCSAPLRIETHAQLRDAIHETTWLLYHWKTLLCQDCTARAAACRAYCNEHDYCIACQRPLDILLHVATRQGAALSLCAACIRADETQLMALTTKHNLMQAAVQAFEATHLSMQAK